MIPRPLLGTGCEHSLGVPQTSGLFLTLRIESSISRPCVLGHIILDFVVLAEVKFLTSAIFVNSTIFPLSLADAHSQNYVDKSAQPNRHLQDHSLTHESCRGNVKATTLCAKNY
jgi:hypothetical protein